MKDNQNSPLVAFFKKSLRSNLALGVGMALLMSIVAACLVVGKKTDERFLLSNFSDRDASQISVGENETLLTNDGNFLFYNAPVSAMYQDKLYFAWVTKNGNVILRIQNADGNQEDKLIHSFSQDIDPKNGKSADDHSAPAIILDNQNESIIIATSYHGTPMFIYSYDIRKNHTNLVKVMEGNYTYPRLLNYQGTIHLIARLQPEGEGGVLIERNSRDGFGIEQIVISSEAGEVIYAGVPTSTIRGFVIAYSILNYKEARLIGFNFLEYDFVAKAVSRQCNLDHLIGSQAYSNRPTGIGFNGKTLMIGTTYEDRKTTEIEPPENFQQKNTVLIVNGQIDRCETFKIVEKRIVRKPYYHTSIAVNDKLSYLYFDDNIFYANSDFPNCFQSESMMYPNLTEYGAVYTVMNQQYSIRNFNNSIIYCKHGELVSIFQTIH